MIRAAVVQSPLVARMRMDTPLYDESRQIATIPAGTVLPYVGVASPGMRAVVVRLDDEACIAYVPADAIFVAHA